MLAQHLDDPRDLLLVAEAGDMYAREAEVGRDLHAGDTDRCSGGLADLALNRFIAADRLRENVADQIADLAGTSCLSPRMKPIVKRAIGCQLLAISWSSPQAN